MNSLNKTNANSGSQSNLKTSEAKHSNSIVSKSQPVVREKHDLSQELQQNAASTDANPNDYSI